MADHNEHPRPTLSAALELRWWRARAARGRSMPSVRQFARLWGWTEARVKRLLDLGPAAAEPDWRGPSWSAGQAHQVDGWWTP